MGDQIYTYALIKAFQDVGRDYIDSFWPFVVESFPSDRSSISLNALRDHVKNRFGLTIPKFTLKSILRRSRKEGYVEHIGNGNYALTDEGVNFQGTIEREIDVERRLNELINDIKAFLNEKLETSVTEQQTRDLLTSFIQKNITSFLEFFSSNSVSEQLRAEPIAHHSKFLVEYIKKAHRSKPDNYNTLREIILGSVISLVLTYEKISDVNKKFKTCEIYLDSNFIFSVMELHFPEVNEPAKELFDILKKYGFKLKIFGVTVDEICLVINGYKQNVNRYASNIRVDSIYSTMKKLGWTDKNAKEFMTNIEDNLYKIGIEIEWAPGIDIKNYTPSNEELRTEMKIYKPDQLLSSQNHDLFVVEKVRDIRGRPRRKIEESKAIFLTSDLRLSKFNFEIMGHNELGTVCEVIPDRLLTNILWLKNPDVSGDIPVKSLIAAHSQDLFVNRAIWSKFISILKELKQREEVSDEQISMLLYHGRIEDALSHFDERETNQITEEFILEKIETTNQLMAEQMEKEIKMREEKIVKKEQKKYEEELKKILEEKVAEIAEKEREKDREWLEKIQHIKENLREIADKRSRNLSTFYSSLATIVFFGGMLLAYSICGGSIWGDIIAFILGGGGIIGIIATWKELRKYLKNKFFNSIFQRKMSEAGLETT